MSSLIRPACDIDEIRRAVHLLVEPGSVRELRIPAPSFGRKLSGYFNDLERMARAAASKSGRAEGIYTTLNPVKPELLARASNTLVPAKHTTSDAEVIRRCWFLIDFDPVRPAGISSTDAEHEAALQRARECREWLRTQGWPEPIFADSGNGAHLLYLINLSNDDQGAASLKSCLIALGMLFSDSTVEVDLHDRA